MNNYDIEKIRDQFPALNRHVWNKQLVYLDSAASMQKPQHVLDSIYKNWKISEIRQYYI